MTIIFEQRTVIPACDVPFDLFSRLVEETNEVPEIGAYKIGAALALRVGLEAVAAEARKFTTKPLIYDHQKAGTDIPETADMFMRTLADCGMNAVILFPLAGSHTQSTWTASARGAGLEVIVGGHMTHPGYLASQGGYIADEAVQTIYEHASGDGVADFVVPGNKPDVIRSIRQHLLSLGTDPIFYAPGFIAQGGSISEAAQAAGPRWHAIVGRGLLEDQHEPDGIHKAALRLVSNL